MPGEVQEAGLEAMLLWTISVAFKDDGLHIFVECSPRNTAEPLEAVGMACQQCLESHIGNELDIAGTAIAQCRYEGEQARPFTPSELDLVGMHLIARFSLKAHHRIRWRHGT